MRRGVPRCCTSCDAWVRARARARDANANARQPSSLLLRPSNQPRLPPAIINQETKPDSQARTGSFPRERSDPPRWKEDRGRVPLITLGASIVALSKRAWRFPPRGRENGFIKHGDAFTAVSALIQPDFPASDHRDSLQSLHHDFN